MASPPEETPSVRPTVAVAPLRSLTNPALRWVGPAIIQSVTERLHVHPELSWVSPRQVHAALRNENLTVEQLEKVGVAARVGRQVGADLLVTGEFTVDEPVMRFALVLVSLPRGEVVARLAVDGVWDELAAMRERMVAAICTHAGVGEAPPASDSLAGDRLTAMAYAAIGMSILDRQSLSPRAASSTSALQLEATEIREAMGFLRKATETDPKYGAAWSGLGVALALTGDTFFATAAFDNAAAHGAGDAASTILGRSFAAIRDDQPDVAEALLRATLERRPGFLHARAYLAALYLETARPQEALAEFDAYLAAVRYQPWVRLRRAQVKARLGDEAGAVADAREAVKELPSSAFAAYERAAVHAALDQTKDARAVVAAAVKKHPRHTELAEAKRCLKRLKAKDTTGLRACFGLPVLAVEDSAQPALAPGADAPSPPNGSEEPPPTPDEADGPSSETAERGSAEN